MAKVVLYKNKKTGEVLFYNFNSRQFVFMDYTKKEKSYLTLKELINTLKGKMKKILLTITPETTYVINQLNVKKKKSK